jgi:hypothetical protein
VLTLEVQGQQVQNPISVGSVGSFVVAMKAADGKVIDQRGVGLFLTVSSPCTSCVSMAVQRSSTVNSASTTYTFSISTAFIPPANMKF